MTRSVVVADYGIGNILSVTRALDRVGAEVVQTSQPRKIEQADRLVLPGVGAFGDCMAELTARGLADPIRRFAETGRPFLGICVGMQMMLDESSEFGVHKGLGLIPGRVEPVPTEGSDGKPHKIPHIGWNRLSPVGDWDESILRGLNGEASAYFVHSFMARPASPQQRLADSDYDGCRITAAIADGPLYGCQFHPEKSGPVGLRVLGNFVEM